MEARLYSKATLLGTVQLAIIDESMGAIGGRLEPSEAYKSLQEYFRQSNGSYDNTIAALKLSLQLVNGCYVYPIGGFSITDVPTFPDYIDLTAPGVYRHIIEDYFLSPINNCFLEEPWRTINPAEKLNLENELALEIGKGHILALYNYCAYARSSSNDDILFAVHRNGCDYGFAVVHLTWKGSPEDNPQWPTTTFYHTFDEFKHQVMYPDKKEWES